VAVRVAAGEFRRVAESMSLPLRSTAMKSFTTGLAFGPKAGLTTRLAARAVRVVCMSAVLGMSLVCGSALAQTPTYQGVLQSAGAAANGTFDFRLSLFAAASGGSAL
jgi:hypothetical protein